MSKVFNLIKFLNEDADVFYSTLRADRTTQYETFFIMKRNKTKRVIEAPIDDDLIRIQNKLRLWLDYEYEKYCSSRVFGFIKNRDIVDNAKEHYNNQRRYILKLDLKDFFTFITYQRVFGLINKGLGATKKSSNAIAMLLTYKKHLPQGASTSPVISNMICKKMDRELNKYANLHNSIYTRYADDITISFKSLEDINKVATKDNNDVLIDGELKDIITKNGFKLNTTKTRLLYPEQSQKICGIVINEKINVRRAYIRDIRTTIHKLKYGEKINGKSIEGKLSFLRHVRGINDNLSNMFCSKYNRLSSNTPFPDSDFRIDLYSAINYYLVRIDTSDEREDNYGTGFFSKGYLVTSRHVVQHDNNSKIPAFPGYYKKLTLHYYKYNDYTKVLTCNVNVIDAFYYDEIAFLKIDSFSLFKDRQLKISKQLIDYKSKDFVYCGCQIEDNSSLGVNFALTRVLSENHYFGQLGYTLPKGTIYKGMSGGPLFDKNNYNVVGVNFSGDGLNNKNNPCVCSVITTSFLKEKKKWVPDEIWLSLNKSW